MQLKFKFAFYVIRFTVRENKTKSVNNVFQKEKKHEPIVGFNCTISNGFLPERKKHLK